MNKPHTLHSAPRISVLIPAYNEEELIPRTLASVHESFATVGVTAYEVIVCDNNSTDRTAAVAQAAGARTVFEPHNQIARARNAAAAAATGEWFIFLDADTLLNAELLRATLTAIRSGKLCGGGSVLVFGEAKLGPFARALARLWTGISVGLRMAAGSYVFCRRDAWAETGGFSEAVYAGEELFFSHRLKRWGAARGLKFLVLTSSPVVTSARKMEWFGQWALLRHVALLIFWPLAIRSREKCDLWYQRPAGAAAKAQPVES